MFNKIKREDVILLLICIVVSAMVYLIFNTNKPFTKIIEENINSIVEIESKTDDNIISKGTGISISKGYIITNYHIIKNNKSISFNTAKSEKKYKANVVSFDIDLDLAILKYNEDYLDLTYVSFEKINNIKLGEEVITIGNSKGYGLSINNGVVSSYVKKIELNDLQREVIQISVPIVDGDSGGAVINKNGKVIGMMAFKTININNNSTDEISFSIPSNIIVEFINDN